jgi:hypothetical protein
MKEPLIYPVSVPRDVSEMFEKLTFEVIRTGKVRYSARAVLHRIRWHYEIERGVREFKCNNNWTPTLSRWFMRKYPNTNGFFEIRTARLPRAELENGHALDR